MPRELDLLTIIATRKPESWVLVDDLHLVDQYKFMVRVHAGCAEAHRRRSLYSDARFFHHVWWFYLLGGPCVCCGQFKWRAP